MAKKPRETTRKKATARPAAKKAPAPKPEGPWGGLTFAMTGVALLLRLAVNATAPFPVYWGEAELWAMARELDWGYFGAPPLAAWVVRTMTDAGGDGLFILRAASPIAHAAAAWLIFLTGRRLWGGATGFWAAAGYTAAPGVAYSAMLMSADPVLLVAWAGALYALIRAAESEGWFWWAVLGAATGVGLLAGYAMLGFAAGGLFYGMFSARERAWRGTGVAMLFAAAVVLPNVAWMSAYDPEAARRLFVFSRAFDLIGTLELAAIQFAIAGPVFLAAIWLALMDRGSWVEDWAMRLVAWQTVPLVAAVLGLALLGHAHAQWAAPAYIGGSLFAARWLVISEGGPALKAQLGIGVAASLGLWTLAGLYAGQAEGLTRRLDPFREMRISDPLCELVLGTMAEEGSEVLLSDDRRRLAECMYYGELGWDEVAAWDPDRRPASHAELIAGLQPGDQRPMLLFVQRGAKDISQRFAEARDIDRGVIETHKDRSLPFQIWSVQGFQRY